MKKLYNEKKLYNMPGINKRFNKTSPVTLRIIYSRNKYYIQYIIIFLLNIQSTKLVLSIKKCYISNTLFLD